jgi:hypothetical protein
MVAGIMKSARPDAVSGDDSPRTDRRLSVLGQEVLRGAEAGSR